MHAPGSNKIGYRTFEDCTKSTLCVCLLVRAQGQPALQQQQQQQQQQKEMEQRRLPSLGLLRRPLPPLAVRRRRRRRRVCVVCVCVAALTFELSREVVHQCIKSNCDHVFDRWWQLGWTTTLRCKSWPWRRLIGWALPLPLLDRLQRFRNKEEQEGRRGPLVWACVCVYESHTHTQRERERERERERD